MMVEVLYKKERVARKEHKCNFCGEVIRIKEKYEFSQLKYEGELYDWKNHIKCGNIARELDMYSQCDDGLDDETFKELLREYLWEQMGDEFDEYDNQDHTYSEQIDKTFELIKKAEIEAMNKIIRHIYLLLKDIGLPSRPSVSRSTTGAYSAKSKKV